MRYERLLSGGGAVLACALLAAAGDKQPPAKGLATPREAFAQMSLALADGDAAKALAAMRLTGDEQKDVIAAIAAFNQAGLRFRAAFIKVYGDKAWAIFQDPTQGPKDGNASLTLIRREDLKPKIDNARIEEKGDDAFVVLPGETKATKLVKVNGGWAVDFEANFTASGAVADGKLADRAKVLTRLAGVVETYRKAIGAKWEGKAIGAEDIDAELGRAILHALSGKMIDAPHRFDVEKLK